MYQIHFPRSSLDEGKGGLTKRGMNKILRINLSPPAFCPVNKLVEVPALMLDLEIGPRATSRLSAYA